LTLVASGVLFTAAGLLLFLHMSVQPVLTGSMRPDYGPGWAVVSRAIPVSSIRPGMIVIFVPPGHSVPFAHRVASVAGSPEHPVLTTKGDANPGPDPWHARIDARSIQEVVFAVPVLGSAMTALHGEGMRIVAVIAFGLIVALTGARAIRRTPRHRRAHPIGLN